MSRKRVASDLAFTASADSTSFPHPLNRVVFKIYDSLVEPGLSQLTPHSAFVNPEAPADALPRQSIEVRALVFY